MYTVLLVDDEEKILEVMKVRIGWQELGVDKLLTASDGQAALEYFEQQRIDLLVTDIRMPRMDGLELIEKVRSLYPDTARRWTKPAPKPAPCWACRPTI